MKKLIIVSLLLLSTVTRAQNNLDTLPMQNDKVVFSRTDAVRAPKDVLFATGKKWMAGDTNTVLQNAYPLTALITGSGHFSLKLKGGSFAGANNRFDFKLLVACDDDQYSITIDTVTFTSSTPGATPVPLETETNISKANANAINMEFLKIYFSLMDAMTNGSSGSPVVAGTYAPQTLAASIGLPEVDGKVTYERVVDAPGKSKDFIFNAANKWVLDNYNNQHNINQNGIILSEDKDQGQILAKAAFSFREEGNLLHPGYNFMYIFNMQIDCKDGRYRIRLYNMVYGNYFNDKNPISMEFYNDELKNSKATIVQQNGANLNSQFKAVMQSLVDAVSKAAHDDF